LFIDAKLNIYCENTYLLELNLLTLSKKLSTSLYFIMPRLHFFYPENDLALALNDVNYTAPRAAVDLRVSGESLPMWLGDSGDRFYTQGISAEWYDAMAGCFDIRADVFDGDIADLLPSPWGWSLPVRKNLLLLGYEEAQLPSLEQIDRIRMLSHRRVSAEIAHRLVALFGNKIGDPAIEVDSTDAVIEYVHTHQRAMLKLPWSSSGRGVVDTLNLSDDEIARRAQGTIRRQGSVMIEPFYNEPHNFAYLFASENGHITFKGYSLFDVDTHCAYSGSVVAADDVLENMISKYVDIDLLHEVRDALTSMLAEIIGTDYSGAFGVDMMIADGKLAVAEMNVRMTMGHVAHILAERYIANGTVGRFTIMARTDNECFMPSDCSIIGGKITSGKLDLVPPDRRHRFILTVG
jgi:hypothetical protein